VAGLAGVAGCADGTNSTARFNNPIGLAFDAAGNLYVADKFNSAIRKMSPSGTNWVVTTVSAAFNDPRGVALDGAGNLYVADTVDETIRKLTPVGDAWELTTIAGTKGTAGTNDGGGNVALFFYPKHLVVDSATNLYVTDTLNYTIRKLTPAGGLWKVTTIAGQAGVPGANDGTGTAAQFEFPEGLALDGAGNIYVADTYNFTIRELAPAGSNWAVTTLVGLPTACAGSADGTGSAARFYNPQGVAVDSAGNVYVADALNNTIRKVTPDGVVTTLAGKAGKPGKLDGTNSAARFNAPDAVAVDTRGNIFVADAGNSSIRKLEPVGTNWVASTLDSGYEFLYPEGLAVDANDNVYVAQAGLWAGGGSSEYGAILKIYPNGVVTNVVGIGGAPSGVALDGAGNIYVANQAEDTISRVSAAGKVTILAGQKNVSGGADGTNGSALFNNPYSLAMDGAGNLYVGDQGNGTIRKMTQAGTNWIVSTLAGTSYGQGTSDGTGSAAQIGPFGVAADSAGNIYVANLSDHTILKGVPASSVPPPALLSPGLVAGQFGFGVTGLPGLAVEIESSADLSQWQVAGSYILDGGTNYYASPNPPLGNQFYRAQRR
jgi:sugar lactone lactonase YvrE